MAVVTRDQPVGDLRALGLEPGAVVLVHASLPQLGNVIGGEQAVIEALLEVLGPDGTLVMPAQSWQLCDPEYLGQADSADWQVIRDSLPAYDPGRTPTRTMGAIAELFRTWPGVVRSGHPHRSFAALGPHADEIQVEDVDFVQVGEAFAAESGTGAARGTSAATAFGAVAGAAGQRTGRVASATAHLMPQRPLVDFAADWFAEHRLSR